MRNNVWPNLTTETNMVTVAISRIFSALFILESGLLTLWRHPDHRPKVRYKIKPVIKNRLIFLANVPSKVAASTKGKEISRFLDMRVNWTQLNLEQHGLVANRKAQLNLGHRLLTAQLGGTKLSG